MGKVKDLSIILDELITAGNEIVSAATALKEYFSSPEETVQEEKTEKVQTPAPKVEPSYTQEDIRAMLSKKANESDGKYKGVVKDLVKKYADGGTLKNIDPSKYAALVAELEEVANG